MSDANKYSTGLDEAPRQHDGRSSINHSIIFPVNPTIECHYCKKIGHIMKDCWKLKGANMRRAGHGRKTSRYATPVRDEQQTVRQPFCTVCRHAGRSESEYTSHFVKDQPGPNGIVVCPLLLRQKCRYCKELGHTPKQCPKLLKRKAKADALSIENDVMNWGWLDAGITPEEEEEARITWTAVDTKRRRANNRLKRMKGTGLGPLNPEDVNMYHDWCAIRWGDWERTGMGATFFDKTTRRKYCWEEWCTKDHFYQKARKLKQHKKNSLHPMREEQVHQCLFAQTLYSNIEEENAMADADREFEYLADLDEMPEFDELH